MIFLPRLDAAESLSANPSLNTYEIIKVEKISSNVYEVDVSRSYLVAQEIRRHYQTKSFSSENMLLQVNCSLSQVNVIGYRWYADQGLQGAIVYASHEESGWYPANKDAAIHQLTKTVCLAE